MEVARACLLLVFAGLGLRAAHLAMFDQRGVVRGELAHGRIGRPRQAGRHSGRKRRHDMDRFVGQRLQRGPPQDAVGLLRTR